jgi:RNA polymerase sigma-70 factor (ECF subfamily)
MPTQRIQLDLSEIAALYQSSAGRIRNWLRKLGVSQEDLPDVQQQVFVVILKTRSSFRGRSSVPTWIYAICRHLAGKYRRAREVREALVPVDCSPGEVFAVDEVSAVEELEARERAQWLRSHLSVLSRRDRRIVQLLDLDGCSYSEATRYVGLTVEAMRLIHHRAHRRLAAAAASSRRRYL